MKTLPKRLLIVTVTLLVIILVSACTSTTEDQAEVNKLMFHHDRERTGWNDRETVLTPQAVSSEEFGLLWESEPLDEFEGAPPRLFAAPLYVHEVEMAQGPLTGSTVSALYVVTTTGYAYAINAAEVGDTPPGQVLWRQRLTEEPCGRGTSGNLSTPIIDMEQHRIYMTTCSGTETWSVHALDIRSGEQLQGWPIPIDATTVDRPGIQKNGNTRTWGAEGPIGRRPQRGALNLNQDGSRLYLTFGEPGGWIVSVDTDEARVASAFSSTALDEEIRMGGIWASSGPSIDDQGLIYVSTGTSGRNGNMEWVYEDSPGNWGQSFLQLRDDPVNGFELVGTYTPFNYCIAAAWDIDLSSSGIIVIDLDSATTSTPRLIAHGGGKQGNAYLLNRAPMPGDLIQRQPCSDDSESDLSLLSPEPQPQFGQRGPISVFGPYSDTHGLYDQAKSRSTPAYYRDASGGNYVFMTGAAKTGSELSESIPPGLVRLEIVTAAGEPAYFEVTHSEMTQTMPNPSSPIVTSNGGRDAVVWVLDPNAERSVQLYGPDAPQPVLYAFDATNLDLLWKSTPGQLATSGKYNEVTVVNGMVFVGTDRIQVFGMRPSTSQTVSESTPVMSDETTIPSSELSAALSEPPSEGRDLYEKQCAQCHSNRFSDAPQEATLAQLSPEYIVNALGEGGIMRTQATGLTSSQINAIADYLASNEGAE